MNEEEYFDLIYKADEGCEESARKINQLDRSKFTNYQNFDLSRTGKYSLDLIGYLFLHGRGGVLQDYSKAGEYFLKSGTQKSLSNLGFLYKEGLGVERDYEMAREYFMKSDNPMSHFALGVFYHKGLGVERDYEKAREYYIKSGMAWNNLGVMYLEGKGGQKDLVEAVRCFMKADSELSHQNIKTIKNCEWIVKLLQEESERENKVKEQENKIREQEDKIKKLERDLEIALLQPDGYGYHYFKDHFAGMCGR